MIETNLRSLLKSYDTETLYKKAKLLFNSELSFPEWFDYVKSGAGKQRLPVEEDWYYLRAFAIMLRSVENPLTVNRLRHIYGFKGNRGVSPDRKYLASGSIIRKIVQELEAKGFLHSLEGKGRVATMKSKKFLIGLIENQ